MAWSVHLSKRKCGLIPDNHARPTTSCAAAALDYSVVDLGVFSAQCLGNRRPVLWSAKSHSVGQATRTVVRPRIGAQDPFQRFVELPRFRGRGAAFALRDDWVS